MTLNADQTGVEAYFGEGLIPDAGMITTLENITTLDLVDADGDKQKVPLVMEDGYMTGKLPEGFGRAALVAGRRAELRCVTVRDPAGPTAGAAGASTFHTRAWAAGSRRRCRLTTRL